VRNKKLVLDDLIGGYSVNTGLDHSLVVVGVDGAFLIPCDLILS
jgi:hypothetical protein